MPTVTCTPPIVKGGFAATKAKSSVASWSTCSSPVQGGVLTQQSPIQALPGLPPLAQNKVHHQYAAPSQSQPSSIYPASLIPNQYAAPSLPLQPWFQTPTPVQHQILQHSPLSGLPTAGHVQSLHPQQTVSLSNRVANQMVTSSSVLTYSGQNAAVAPVQPPISIPKPSSLNGPAMLNNGNKDYDKPQQISHNPPWGRNIDHHPNMVSRLHENASFISDKDQTGHPPKLLKMEDGRGALFSTAGGHLNLCRYLEIKILKQGPLTLKSRTKRYLFIFPCYIIVIQVIEQVKIVPYNTM